MSSYNNDGGKQCEAFHQSTYFITMTISTNLKNYMKAISHKTPLCKISLNNILLQAKTYAYTSPNFKAKQLNDINLILTDEPVLPRISVQILKNNNFQAKSGLCTVYEIAFHDQMHDWLQRNPEIKDNGSCVKDYKRKFDIYCTEKDFIKTLDMINKQFVAPKIQKRYIDNALNLAPIGYRLYNLKVDTGFDYSDTPANTTQEEYEKLIKDISFNDVQEYSDNILKNSDIHVALSANREFYNKHEEEIQTLLINIFNATKNNE